MPKPSLPVAPPLEGNDQLIVAVVTAGWAIALIILVLLRGHLAAADRWWVWVPAAGCSIGLFGLVYMPFLKRQRARAALARAGRGSAGKAELAGAEPAGAEPADTEPAEAEPAG